MGLLMVLCVVICVAAVGWGVYMSPPAYVLPSTCHLEGVR